MGALRPEKGVRYCFRLDGEANRIPVRRSEEEDKYVRPGFHRLKAGEIVPRRGKKAAAEREEDGAGNQAERGKGNGKGLKRKWLYAPLEDAAAESESAVRKKTKRQP